MKVGPKPLELQWAEALVAIGERFGVLPTHLLDEDASLLRMLGLLKPDLGKAKE